MAVEVVVRIVFGDDEHVAEPTIVSRSRIPLRRPCLHLDQASRTVLKFGLVL
jgi:hypothetical protein